MKRVHIIGGKNHGKTTLIVDLVAALSRQGLRVGTIKHTHHEHELDTPGKDSHRHREAGAAVVGICSPSLHAVFWPPHGEEGQSRCAGEDERKYEAFAPLFAECDVVLVEGDTQTTATKLEVWRRALGTPPLVALDPSISAVITDDVLEQEVDVPSWRRSDIGKVARNLLLVDRIVDRNHRPLNLALDCPDLDAAYSDPGVSKNSLSSSSTAPDAMKRLSGYRRYLTIDR